MSCDVSWQTTIGTIASTAGLTGFALGGAKGVIAGYNAFISPNTALAESERKLKRVRSQLNGLSPQRRKEIEIATQSRSSSCTNLTGLENQLQDLMDMHCRLSKRCDESTFVERNIPFSEFRGLVSRLEVLARRLLNDTLKTTVPCVDDITYYSNNLRPQWPG